jgi:hypothetical protein
LHRLRATPQPHQHWHIDVSYINISGTFHYQCSVLDEYSQFIVHWDLRESTTEAATEIIFDGASRNTYGLFKYGNQRGDPLPTFKVRNGFEEILMPRYFVPLNGWGKLRSRPATN